MILRLIWLVVVTKPKISGFFPLIKCFVAEYEVNFQLLFLFHIYIFTEEIMDRLKVLNGVS